MPMATARRRCRRGREIVAFSQNVREKAIRLPLAENAGDVFCTYLPPTSRSVPPLSFQIRTGP
jgi:hypothetical protein